MARSFFALTALACLVPAGRGPCNARITHRSGDVATAAANASQALADAAAAQADADSAASAASSAQSTADSAASAASTAQTAADAAQSDADQAISDAAAAQSTATDAQTAAGDIGDSLASTGIAMLYAPTSVTGTGFADAATVTVPSALTLTNGRRYGVEGRVYARKADGTLLMAKKIEGVELLRSGGNFSLVAEGDERLLSAAHADIGTYFTAENRRPAVGFDGASITLDWQAENGQSFILEADLSIADLGVATV